MFLMTVLSGVFSWSIVLTFTKPTRLLLVIAGYISIMFVLSYADPQFLKPDVPRIVVTPNIPVRVTSEQLADIETKRSVFGIVAALCISAGYGLFVNALGKANKRRAAVEAEVELARIIHESLLPKSTVTIPWCEIG